jgi:hypothetical protein
LRLIRLLVVVLPLLGCIGCSKEDPLKVPAAASVPVQPTATASVSKSGRGKVRMGLTCTLESDKSRYARSEPIRLNLDLRVEDAPGTDTPDWLRAHILLPRSVDRNHLIKVVVTNRNNEDLLYQGPLPPMDIGDVEDLTLDPGRVIKRNIEISRWFDFNPEDSPFQVRVLVQPWSYETLFPHYWTGRLESNGIAFSIQ